MSVVGKQMLVLLVISNAYFLFQTSVARRELTSEKKAKRHAKTDAATAQADRLSSQLRKTEEERDQLFKKVIVLVDQVQQYQAEAIRLEEYRVQLVTQLDAQRKVLNAHGLSVPPAEIRRKPSTPEDRNKKDYRQPGELGRIAIK